MFDKDLLLIWRYGENRRLRTFIRFYNEEKYKEFLNAQNKRYCLQSELQLEESYFWNTYIDFDDNYFNEIDDEMKLDEEIAEVDSFIIK